MANVGLTLNDVASDTSVSIKHLGIYGSGWLGSGHWKQRVKVSLDGEKPNSDLTHFPVPILLGDGNFTNVKSVILDLVDNQGSSERIALSYVRFYKDGELLEFEMDVDFTAYETASSGAGYEAKYVFDQDTDGAGSLYQNGYLSAYNTTDSMRLICVFDEPISFDSAYYSNGHEGNGWEDWGVETLRFHVSSDAITSTTFDEAISNSTKLFDDDLIIHASHSSADPKAFSLTAMSRFMPIFDEIGADFSKMAITKGDGETELFCEVENWDEEGTGCIQVSHEDWEISATGENSIYIYYDDDQVDNSWFVGSTGEEAAQKVWADGFAYRYSLAQDPNGNETNNIIDSTSNQRHATTQSMYSNNLVDTQIGKGLDFSGYEDKVVMEDDVDFTSELTLSVVMKRESGSATKETILRKAASFGLFWETDGDISFSAWYSNDLLTTTTPLTTETWGLLAATYENTGSDTIKKIFADGSEEGSNNLGSATDLLNRTEPMCIGSYEDDTLSDTFTGILRDVRAYDGVLSDDWLEFDSHAQANDLVTFGENAEGEDDLRGDCASETEVTDVELVVTFGLTLDNVECDTELSDIVFPISRTLIDSVESNTEITPLILQRVVNLEPDDVSSDTFILNPPITTDKVLIFDDVESDTEVSTIDGLLPGYLGNGDIICETEITPVILTPLFKGNNASVLESFTSKAYAGSHGAIELEKFQVSGEARTDILGTGRAILQTLSTIANTGAQGSAVLAPFVSSGNITVENHGVMAATLLGLIAKGAAHLGKNEMESSLQPFISSMSAITGEVGHIDAVLEALEVEASAISGVIATGEASLQPFESDGLIVPTSINTGVAELEPFVSKMVSFQEISEALRYVRNKIR